MRNFGDLSEQIDAQTALNQHKYVDDKQTTHNSVDPEASAGKQVCAGGNPLHRQGAEQDGHYRVAGNSQSQHGDHCAAGGGVVGGLRR